MFYRMFAAMLVVSATAVYAQSAQQQMPSEQAPGAVVTPAPDTAGTPTGPMDAISDIHPQLAEMTAGEIEGRPLLNAQGDTLGTVRDVVRDNADGSLNAIVGVGGFLGFGQRQVVVPLSEIQFQDNQLVTTLAETSSDLRNRAKPYKAEDFQALSEQTRISEAATGSTPGRAAMPGTADLGGISFESLDKDRDGFISSQEVGQNEALANLMSSLDTNGDGRLDQAEFAIFSEQMQSAPMQQRPRDAIRDEEQLRRRDELRQREPAQGMR